MSLNVLAQAERSRILLLPVKDDRVVFEGYLRIKDTPKGPRPYKFLVKRDTERYLSPDDSVRLLRRAKGIFIVDGEEALEQRFLELLNSYQLKHHRISVCKHCLGKRKITLLGENAVKYRQSRICYSCAIDEINREADFRGIGRAGRKHLAGILARRKNLDDVIDLLNLERIDPELTRFDVMEASENVSPLKLDDLEVPDELKEFLKGRLTNLLPVQALAVNKGLLKGKSLLVVSATATGKSLIGEMAGIKNLLDGRGKFLFLVPLVALANQKFDQLSAYSELGFKISIRVGVSRIKFGRALSLPTDLAADIIVGTYEGIDQLLRSRRDLGKIGTVVIDEVHMLEDNERGHRLSGLIARLRFVAPGAQFIYLSATVGNPAALSKRLGVDLVEYEIRPVPIERHLIFTNPGEKLSLIRKLVSSAASLTSSTGYRGQTIIFTNSRRKCFAFAQAIPGAVAYHAGLQYHERKRIEEMFAQGRINAVVTTSALAAGVDFPASQVIFETLAMGIEWLSVHEFNQMLGRAGRPGYHDKGIVYILAEPGKRYSSVESEDEIALRLLSGSVEDVAPEYEEQQQLEEVLANTALVRSIDELKRLHSYTIGLDDLDRSLAILREKGLVRGVAPTRLGMAVAAHFLTPEQAEIVLKGIELDKEPLEIAVDLEQFDAIFLKAAERISATLRMQISERIFHGSFFELIASPDLLKLPRNIQAECLRFASDFMRCTCNEAPYCGCVERAVSLKILDLRSAGNDPKEIIDLFSDEYGIYAYHGDLINYLDQIVRYLEAVEAIAHVGGKKDIAEKASKAKKKIEGEG